MEGTPSYRRRSHKQTIGLKPTTQPLINFIFIFLKLKTDFKLWFSNGCETALNMYQWINEYSWYTVMYWWDVEVIFQNLEMFEFIMLNIIMLFKVSSLCCMSLVKATFLNILLICDLCYFQWTALIQLAQNMALVWMACAYVERAGKGQTVVNQTQILYAACQIVLNTVTLMWIYKDASVMTTGLDPIVHKVIERVFLKYFSRFLLKYFMLIIFPLLSNLSFSNNENIHTFNFILTAIILNHYFTTLKYFGVFYREKLCII